MGDAVEPDRDDRGRRPSGTSLRPSRENVVRDAPRGPSRRGVEQGALTPRTCAAGGRRIDMAGGGLARRAARRNRRVRNRSSPRPSGHRARRSALVARHAVRGGRAASEHAPADRARLRATRTRRGPGGAPRDHRPQGSAPAGIHPPLVAGGGTKPPDARPRVPLPAGVAAAAWPAGPASLARRETQGPRRNLIEAPVAPRDPLIPAWTSGCGAQAVATGVDGF